MTKYVAPIVIKKESSPYLYLTDYSGFYVNEYQISGATTGIYYAINQGQQLNYHLLSLQIWFRYPKDNFESSMEILRIIDSDFITDVTLTLTAQTDTKYAMVESNYSTTFYQNGMKVISPLVQSKQWNSLYLVFDPPLSFNSVSGKIKFGQKFVFSNINQFVYENELAQDFKSLPIAWIQIMTPNLTQPLIKSTWQNIKDGGTWEEESVVTSPINNFLYDGEYIFSDQTGTSVVVAEDMSGFEIYSNGTDLFTNVEWTTFEKTFV